MQDIEFNLKLESLLRRFSAENKIYNEVTLENQDFEIFVYLNEARKTTELTQLRILFMASFLGHFYQKKVQVHVDSASTRVETLEHTLRLFNLEKTIEIVPVRCDDVLGQIDQRYQTVLETGEVLIDFKQLIDDLGLKYYDSNLKKCPIDDIQKILACYIDFLNHHHSPLIIHLCPNGEYFQRQKVDIISRVLSECATHRTTRYISVGCVKSDLPSEPDSILSAYELRERYFKYSAEQRQLLPDEFNSSNMRHLTQFSFSFDLLSSTLQGDLTKFKLAEFAQTECGDGLKLCEQSSFILYNCARLNAIIEKFDSLVQRGVYEKLPDASSLDFDTLLKTDSERKLICDQLLFKLDSILIDLINLDTGYSMLSKVNVSRLIKFACDLSAQFSKYYSKIHILEDAKFPHLHATMQARIHLIKLIYQIFQFILSLFSVEALKRI